MENLYTYIFVAAIISAFVGNYIAKQKGRSATEGLLFGFFGGILGLIIVALLPTKNKSETVVEIEDKEPTEEDIKRAKEMGINDLSKKYELNEIIKGDSIFCATGITAGDMVSGIKIDEDNFISETLVTHKDSCLKKVVKLNQKIIR